MAINEKTFELNITNELLNTSKAFLWYLSFSPISHLLPRDAWRKLLMDSAVYAEGLTQDQEANLGGGYDVSINVNNVSPYDPRLLLLQYKAGKHKNYCRNNQSQFYQPLRPPVHIQFRFNDAARGTQHIILRNLANQRDIQSESVMYVFPRITEVADFRSKIGNLIWHSSFVPVLDIDRQAANQNPTITIRAGTPHNYRTTYDGLTSEVNYYYYKYFYDGSIVERLLGEICCVQIERVLKTANSLDTQVNSELIDKISATFNEFVSQEVNNNILNNTINESISNYLIYVKQNLRNGIIAEAPEFYTTTIHHRGNIKMKFEEYMNFDKLQYQIF